MEKDLICIDAKQSDEESESSVSLIHKSLM